jgi:2-polyprenyl-3-methyl-5-hydroxy-6-metoxy-1,4-benzoquinol methylase
LAEPSSLPLVPAEKAVVCPDCGGGLVGDRSTDPAGTGCRCTGCGRFYAFREGILHLTVGAAGAQGYDPHYFTALPLVEESHFWFVHRREVILATLRQAVPDWPQRPLFDIGCGSGGLLAYLARAGVPVAGACDAYVQGLRLCRQRLEAPLMLLDEGAAPPLAPGHLLLGMFDVLEHLDDDVGVLSGLHAALAPRGVLILTVPAHPWLFDEMDALAHHRRRYRRAELREKLAAAGFEPLQVRHFMALLVPLLVAARALGRMLPGRLRNASARRDAELGIVPFLNPLLLGLLRLEDRLWRLLPLPFGTSLVAVARRPAA